MSNPVEIISTTIAPTQSDIFISNQSFGITITNVTVNGIGITGITFPITTPFGGTGYYGVGTTTQLGTQSISIYYTTSSGDDERILLTDCNGQVTCFGNLQTGNSSPVIAYTQSIIAGTYSTIVPTLGTC